MKVQVPDVIVLDFESEAIRRRPQYPPRPVGLSVQFPGERKPTYYAWGHPTENNCDRNKGARVLRDIWKRKEPVLCHHGKFDIDLAETEFELPAMPWERIHDTEYLLFLENPHAFHLALKPSAERVLGIKPEERDILKDWILSHVPEAKKKPSTWGEYICRAPGRLVGKYADGDIYRTKKLFQHLYPEIVNRRMLAAYDRERQLMPILLSTERRGIRVDWARLENDYNMYQKARETAANWLRKKLHAPNLNPDSDVEMGDVLEREGIVTEWVMTPTGQRSVSKKNMTIDKFSNKQIASVYGYFTRLGTCLGTFFEPWLEMARASNGFIFTNWNQVRQDHGGSNVGTRTGRLSSNPNLQNISKDFEAKDDGYTHPAFLKQLPKLPLMRQYLLPDEGGIWLHRDYNQQELRMLAHFEDGELQKRYNEQPRFDIHTAVQGFVEEFASIKLSRSGTKIVNFSDIYGKGAGNLAISLGVSLQDVKRIKAAKNALMPGIDELNRIVKMRGVMGIPIRTWGGREYYAEPSAYSKKFKRVMDFYYKLLNYLIQGSSADVTKEATIRYHNHPQRESRFLLTVHDEENASSPDVRKLSPKARWDVVRREMAILDEVMQSVEVDVPMVTDGKIGVNWGALEKFDGEDKKEDHPCLDVEDWERPINR